MNNSLSPREAVRLAARLCREFAPALRVGLSGLSTIHYDARSSTTTTCWLDGEGRFNYAQLLTYQRPYRDERQRPLILRVSINTPCFDGADHVREGMHWPAPSAFPKESHPWRFELSLLPDQVLDFAPWVAALAEAKARRDESSLLPTPPHPCFFWGGQNLDCSYAWTQAAWEVIADMAVEWQAEAATRSPSRWLYIDAVSTSLLAE